MKRKKTKTPISWDETCEKCGHVFLAFHPEWAEPTDVPPEDAYVPVQWYISEDGDDGQNWQCPSCGQEWTT
jgi:ribosomal protein S27AE